MIQYIDNAGNCIQNDINQNMIHKCVYIYIIPNTIFNNMWLYKRHFQYYIKISYKNQYILIYALAYIIFIKYIFFWT